MKEHEGLCTCQLGQLLLCKQLAPFLGFLLGSLHLTLPLLLLGSALRLPPLCILADKVASASPSAAMDDSHIKVANHTNPDMQLA